MTCAYFSIWRHTHYTIFFIHVWEVFWNIFTVWNWKNSMKITWNAETFYRWLKEISCHLLSFTDRFLAHFPTESRDSEYTHIVNFVCVCVSSWENDKEAAGWTERWKTIMTWEIRVDIIFISNWLFYPFHFQLMVFLQ